ncbi:hypothetical protein MY494_12955 [Synechococcus sp. A10-1-5-1]|jgi:D-serine deaminase-like pyridoxal phosphate-dependent protein|uniref:hypothetical protein n=1 Tax=Synechococcus sp. A10-1-5-1 TaxID=2936507 RepID=UPI002000CEDB|nr:hypothetical protein [Synechococcus sp. A10-1-5-1]UPM50193.1 hypothetical protein MY494_12955 [Synechococcus sp. A10-1-5-1]
MSEEDFLQALSSVDEQLSSHSSWQQIKDVASVYPWSLGGTQLTPGQQCVLAFWRILSRDDQGQSTAPMPGEGTSAQIQQSLSDFQEDFETSVLINTDLDLDSIRELFAALAPT